MKLYLSNGDGIFCFQVTLHLVWNVIRPCTPTFQTKTHSAWVYTARIVKRHEAWSLGMWEGNNWTLFFSEVRGTNYNCSETCIKRTPSGNAVKCPLNTGCPSVRQVSIDNVIWGVKCHSNEQWKRLEYSQRLWRYTFALISLLKWTNWS